MNSTFTTTQNVVQHAALRPADDCPGSRTNVTNDPIHRQAPALRSPQRPPQPRAGIYVARIPGGHVTTRPTTTPLRIRIVHRSPVYAQGLSDILAGKGRHIVVDPDDINASGTESMSQMLIAHIDEPALAELTADEPETKLILIINTPEQGEYQRALALDPIGVFSETDTPETINMVVTAAATGQTVLPHHVMKHLATESVITTPAGVWLSDNDTVILTALAHGQTIGALAKQIGYSERATHSILAKLYRRLNVANRSEAIALAARWGMTQQNVDQYQPQNPILAPSARMRTRRKASDVSKIGLNAEASA